MYPQQPGTYCFLNIINNKVYIGSTQCLNTRINHHIKGIKSNKYLQRSIDKYTINNFKISYVITETQTEALIQEQLMLDYLFQNNVPKYNLNPNAVGGAGLTAKIRFALEVNNPETIYIFKSSIKAENFTGVASGNIFRGCKAANPENGKGRWLFSDVSEADLKTKFKFLEHKKLIGNKETNNSRNKKQGFKLINKKTGEISQIFYKLEEPLIYGYKIHVGNLSQCLLGNRKTVNGYQIYLT